MSLAFLRRNSTLFRPFIPEKSHTGGPETHTDMKGSKDFPGIIGFVNCMHWSWKNCPKAWHGMCQGRNHKPTVVLEAVATLDLWIWAQVTT